MKDRERPVLTLSYKETEALIRAVHDVREPKAKALFARFKYLQRMDFPSRGTVGRGSRVGYAFEDVLRILMVFQLVEMGVMPVRTVRMLRTNWPEIRGAIRDAWLALQEKRSLRDAPVLAMMPQAMLELGVDEGEEAPVPDPFRRMSRSELCDWLTPPAGEIMIAEDGSLRSDDRMCSWVVVDPVRSVRLVRAVLPVVSSATLEDVDSAFGDLAPA